jgi:hypothetical protein
VVVQELLEVLKVVALGCNLIGIDERFGFILLGDVFALGRVEGGQVGVGNPGAVKK